MSDNDGDGNGLSLLPLLTAVIILILSGLHFFNQGKTKARKSQPVTTTDIAKQTQSSKDKENNKSRPPPPASKKSKPAPAKKIKPTSHPRFRRKFGGHSGNGPVLATSISPQGDWIATSGDDAQLRIVRTGGTTAEKNIFLKTDVAPANEPRRKNDRVRSVSWAADNRTVVCAIETGDYGSEVAFYRMRKKRDAAAGAEFPYELIELSKHRFSVDSKLENLSSCLVDRSAHVGTTKEDLANAAFSLILTSGVSHGTADVSCAVAWNGKTGSTMGSAKLGRGAGAAGERLRLSSDGEFVCGRCGASSTEMKIYRVKRKRVKGEVNPVFDKLVLAGVITCRAKIADVDFLTRESGDDLRVCDKIVACCVNGDVMVWDVSGQKPEKLCVADGPCLGVSESPPVEIVASGDGKRVAVATRDSGLHLFTYSDEDHSIRLDFSIERAHSLGVACMEFCPTSSDVLYTLGDASKEVFSWNV
eukprot:CAMPEP_0172503756 /NCGR_PEP_ID=MMETSP1066-20121228/172049_1 /TAXON_ID=671091 /ORGANISM="Coscinodiscus wailesii, Strain CCMP2513" /LENGTH=473 /DNA_ID=CAMNT_0013279625 /DNA_START=63 /DNA_END=1484 /DNA_ORIENTATION=+